MSTLVTKRWFSIALVPLTVLSLALSSCGSDSAEISPGAATELDTKVGEVRAAVEAGELLQARELLTSLRTTVVELMTTGGITTDRALVINRSIDELDAQIVQSTPTTTQPPTTTRPATTTTRAVPTTSTTTSTTTTAKPPKGGPKDNGNNGNGNGRGNRDDDD